MKTLVENRLKNALKRLYYYDSEIIRNNSHERSITHRLAIHLGTVFYEWDVDVEYNRNLGDIKRIEIITTKLINMIRNKNEIVSGEKSVYPDIIVHKRNTNKNYLVIEVKKAHATEELDRYDKEKLKAYLIDDTLQYKFAAFIKLGDINERPNYQLILKTRKEILSEISQGELHFG
jgi:hypothetical protein